MDIKKPTKEEAISIGIKALATVLAFLLPPVAILVMRGTVNQFILNVILTFIFWVPGIIHALYVVFADEK